jgi:hypothetical protein
LIDDQREVAFVIVEMGLETCNGEALGHLDYGAAHAEWLEEYASEGGTCFLKLNCVGFGWSKDGYIK